MWHSLFAKPESNLMPLLRLLLLLPLLLTTACGTVGYYSQAINGHLTLMSKARPIDKVLADPATADDIKQQLEWAVRIRRFAIDELQLPDNGSYLKYVQLDRPNVLWNVLATPELSLKPKTSCAPVVGCVAYRNYYTLEGANRYAGKLEQKGYDVYIGSVTAYSTIGWFKDPLVSSMMNRGLPELAGVIFHELGHQEVFAKSDTAFNESFATVVETEGVRRWLASTSGDFGAYLQSQQRYRQFIDLVLKYREQLRTLYASSLDDAGKRERKRAIFSGLADEYKELKKSWGGYTGFDRWMNHKLNNAKLASIGNYHGWVPHLQQLLKNSGGDLPRFYKDANRLARLRPDERKRELQALLSP